MMFPSKEIVERVRRKYPVGCRVELVRMDDVQAPPIGTKGTVTGVDDTASLMVAWGAGCRWQPLRSRSADRADRRENGSGLNVVYGEDICRRIDG